MKQHFANLYAQIGVTADLKAHIDKKFEKINQTVKDKIVNTVAISEYFDQLWKQPDLKENDKNLVIKKLEAIHQGKKEQIIKGEQEVSKTSADLDEKILSFQMTPFEQFNYQEKLKDIKKNRHLDMESDLFASRARDLDVLHALNKSTATSKKLNSGDILHYTAGLCACDEDDSAKMQKAEEFVKKIKDEKKAFVRKMKQIEKNVETRENQEIERYKQEEQKEEEQRLKEKKQRLEAHIKELKARGDVRQKESTKWEEEYKAHLDKKPMFKEMEAKFKKGFVIPELEERKKKLQDIRNFHKPITKEDIMEHEQKVTKIVEDHALGKKEYAQTSRWAYQKPDFESKYHKTFADELSRVRRQKEDGLSEQLKRKEKINELLQDVKDNHYPKVDPQKELELMGIVEKLKKRKDNRSWAATEEEEHEQVNGRKLGVEYLKSVRELVQKIKKDHHTGSDSKPELSKHATMGSGPSSGGPDKKMELNTVRSEGALKKHDYLADLRKEHKIQDSNNHVDLIIKNKKLNEKEKEKMLYSEVGRLEEKAKRKEMVKKHKTKDGAAEHDQDDGEVDQIYINAIKAKLQLLGH